MSGNEADLIKELQNERRPSYEPAQSHDILILEVESNIMVRETQLQISNSMISPPNNENAVMQLNMGEGKSSVIVPIVASSLADGSKLVRVIVGKPQSKQMFEMLVSKLGGLLNRRIYHMPFSRRTNLEEYEISVIEKLYKKCMDTGGILLVQPEHILSFQLMAIESFIREDSVLGNRLLAMQHFFRNMSRDIIDESDENLSVKFELVYTIGQQRPVENSPDRWLIIQHVLGLVLKHIPEVGRALPQSVELCNSEKGQFPRTRLIRADAAEKLTEYLARDICNNGLPGFPVSRQGAPFREAVYRYITQAEPKEEDIEIVQGNLFWNQSTKPFLLLIRGLLAGKILGFAFEQKRWRVNYGLHPTRTPATRLAVPYRAKDCPTDRSEFSHPDVVIVLTCLCYYYGGLSNEDLFTAFSHLFKGDQADLEYQSWVAAIPDKSPASFRHIKGVNIHDRTQCINCVFPHLRFSKAVIDYFLGHVVFPREAKEYPNKLSASGWDLSQVKPHPTTGFSGTNDSRHVLPLGTRQLDLPGQMHTNAMVLEHLLRPENTVVSLPLHYNNTMFDSRNFLNMVTAMNPKTRVILDVGAQIIDLSNIEVAEAWLDLTEGHDIHGVVFCDEYDMLSVLDRRGNVEALQKSSLAKSLDLCLIYLDEAHTRGIDLRLPQHYRAAVTLGANLAKDRLVQGMCI